MPTWAWILTAFGAAIVAGVAVYLGWTLYLLRSFINSGG